MGTYDNLDDAIPDVNNWLSVYDIQIDELKEYPCTFGMCFDKEVETKDEQFLMIRGFILE